MDIAARWGIDCSSAKIDDTADVRHPNNQLYYRRESGIAIFGACSLTAPIGKECSLQTTTVHSLYGHECIVSCVCAIGQSSNTCITRSMGEVKHDQWGVICLA